MDFTANSLWLDTQDANRVSATERVLPKTPPRHIIYASGCMRITLTEAFTHAEKTVVQGKVCIKAEFWLFRVVSALIFAPSSPPAFSSNFSLHRNLSKMAVEQDPPPMPQPHIPMPTSPVPAYSQGPSDTPYAPAAPEKDWSPQAPEKSDYYAPPPRTCQILSFIHLD